MKKSLKIFIVLVLIAVAIFFITRQFQGSGPDEARIEAMRQSLINDPEVSIEDLTDEQLQRFLDRFEEAKEQVINLNFDTLRGVNDIAFIKHSLGDFEGAITAYEYGNLIRPDNSLTFSNLATLYHFDLHDFAKAEKNYLISIANAPSDIPTIRNLYEMYHFTTQEDNKAEALLLAAINDNPESIDLYSLAGSFYKDIGESGKAIEFFERHLEFNPGNDAVIKALEGLKNPSGE